MEGLRENHDFKLLSKQFSLLLWCFVFFFSVLGSGAVAGKRSFYDVGPTFNLTPISFDEGYSHLFGEGHLVRSPDARSVRLLLDTYSGSGFISSTMYNHGFFGAKIKLPADNTAGICVAFYTSNVDVYEKTHDELDFEFLGGIPGKPWRFQTNMYGNGSTNRGREERYSLWFDPSKDFHRYSIVWTDKKIIFYVDEVPIREIKRNPEMGLDFPAKPMSLYATIWDASSWATAGGKYKVDYRYAPFAAEFKELSLEGCPLDPIQQIPAQDCAEKEEELESRDFANITPAQENAMRIFRQRHMYYSYCYDTLRYPVPPAECELVSSEQELFRETGRLKFPGSHRTPRGKRKRRRGKAATDTRVE